MQTALARTYPRWVDIADKSLADAYMCRVMINTRTEWWRARRLEEVPTPELPERSVDDGAEQRADRAMLLETVDGPHVEVRDHGPGFPEDLLREGPSRFRTGSSDRAGSGHGLGLTIATGQTRVLGARLTFRNVPEEQGGGAVARLLLPRE